MTDSSIAPLQNQRFSLTDVSCLLDTRNGYYNIERKVSIYFLVCKKVYRSTTSGRVSRDTAFQEIRPGAGFETGDFVKKKRWGGYRRTTPGASG